MQSEEKNINSFLVIFCIILAGIYGDSLKSKNLQRRALTVILIVNNYCSTLKEYSRNDQYLHLFRPLCLNLRHYYIRLIKLVILLGHLLVFLCRATVPKKKGKPFFPAWQILQSWTESNGTVNPHPSKSRMKPRESLEKPKWAIFPSLILGKVGYCSYYLPKGQAVKLTFFAL